MRRLWSAIRSKKRILYLPIWVVFWNELMYYTGRFLATGKYHYNFTLPFEKDIPFLPWTILIYWGCVLVWAGSYMYLAAQDKPTRFRFFFADFISKIISFFFFVFLPTTTVRPEITGTDFWSLQMQLLYWSDAPNNLFPSIHCLVSWLCWVGLRKQKECPAAIRWGVFFAAIGVFLSTLTTKQHVVVDLIGAVIVGELCDLLSGILTKRLFPEKVINVI